MLFPFYFEKIPTVEKDECKDKQCVFILLSVKFTSHSLSNAFISSLFHLIYNSFIQQILAPTMGQELVEVPDGKKIRRYGELFQAWEMRLSPHSEKPVGSEVGGQDPWPWIGSPVGNQAYIVS